MSELEQKWRKTGLLDGTEGIDAELLADNLEQCARHLVTEGQMTGETPYMTFKAGTLLPIIVRLFHTGIRILNIGLLYDNYTRYLRDNPWFGAEETDFVEIYLEHITTDDRVDAFFL